MPRSVLAVTLSLGLFSLGCGGGSGPANTGGDTGGDTGGNPGGSPGGTTSCAAGLVRCEAGCCPAVSLSAGNETACALDDAGALRCWGAEYAGMLGDGSFDACPSQSCPTPRPVVGLSSGVTHVSAGGGHSCAVLATGEVRCWGYNSGAELGTGTSSDPVNTPVTVVGLGARAVEVSAGQGTTCALLEGGAVKCWGGSWSSPVAITLPRAPRTIALGSRLCAILDDGTLACETARSSYDGITMALVGGLTNVTKVCSGSSHTCAVVGGAVYCWGYNGNYQCGQVPTLPDGLTVAEPTAVAGLEPSAVDVVCGWTHSCALSAGGVVQCWGQSDYGQVGFMPSPGGNGSATAVPRTIALTGVAAIAASGSANFTCALTAEGKVACWGSNSYGQLGSGLRPDQLLSSSSPRWLLSP